VFGEQALRVRLIDVRSNALPVRVGHIRMLVGGRG
jgi:hypothetical protein